MELSQNERCEYMHVHEDIVAKVEKAVSYTHLDVYKRQAAA